MLRLLVCGCVLALSARGTTIPARVALRPRVQPEPLSPERSTLRELYKAARDDSRLVRGVRERADRDLLEGRVSSVKDAHTCVSIYKLSGGPTSISSALRVLSYLDAAMLEPDTFFFNNLLDLCAKGTSFHDDDDDGDTVRIALGLMSRMELMGIEKDVKTFTSVIQTCANAGQ